ncbi:phage tail tape measure protein, partial [Campylobacter canadensis]
MGLDLGIGIKLAFDGFNGIRDKQTSLKVLGRVAKLSADDMNKLNASIAKLNKLDIKTKLASKELKNFKDELSGNLARIGALAVPVKFAGDFESALADFNNAAKLSDFELKDMSEYFLKLSNHINISSTQIASLGQNIAKLGVPKSDLKDYLSSAAKLQLALGFSTDETNAMLSSLGTHFKLTSKDVLGLGDEILTLSSNFNASSRSIASITSRLGASAKMFGLNAKESAVLGAAFLQVAKDEETAENSINSLNEKLLNSL